MSAKIYNRQKVYFKIIKAFSLTELMIAVVLIGTLATLSIPVYRDYGIRAEISEVISLAKKDMQRIEEYVMIHGVPANNSELVALNSEITYLAETSNLVSSATLENNGYRITISGSTLPTGMSLDLYYFFSTINNSISWFCAYGPATTNVTNANIANADKKYLPKNCNKDLLTDHSNFSTLY